MSLLIVLILFATAPASLAWIPALQGVSIGAFVLYVGHTVGLVRFYLLAILSFILGPLLSVVGLGDTLGTCVYFAIMGSAFLLSGVATLLNYLRATRPSGVE